MKRITVLAILVWVVGAVLVVGVAKGVWDYMKQSQPPAGIELQPFEQKTWCALSSEDEKGNSVLESWPARADGNCYMEDRPSRMVTGKDKP